MVKKVGASSLGKLVGTVNALIGLVVGVIMSITATVGVIANNEYSIFADIFISIGLVLLGVIVYPLVMFMFGWIYGALVGVVFNLVIGVSGGLELTTEDEKTTK